MAASQLRWVLLAVMVMVAVFVTGTRAWGEEFEADEPDEQDEYDLSVVTCGSVIKLQHVATEHRLHSHQVNYGGGSGQQSVTGYPDGNDVNSLWIIKSGSGQPDCIQGKPIAHNDVIRIQHLATGKNLHSHNFQAPLSENGGLEVSCFGENGNGDAGDDWVVDLPARTGFWARGEVVRFKHLVTKTWLSSHRVKFQRPIAGQNEVLCKRGKTNEADWKTQEGIYFPKAA